MKEKINILLTGFFVFRKIFSGILNAALFCFLCLAVMISLPAAAGIHCFAVVSGSMEPAISVGSAVYVKPVSFSELEKGDVITYLANQGRTAVTHRITEIHSTDQSVSTKGDANNVQDAGSVTSSNILGKVTFHIPYLGFWMIQFEKTEGKLAMIGTLLGAILLSEWLNHLGKEKSYGIFRRKEKLSTQEN